MNSRVVLLFVLVAFIFTASSAPTNTSVGPTSSQGLQPIDADNTTVTSLTESANLTNTSTTATPTGTTVTANETTTMPAVDTTKAPTIGPTTAKPGTTKDEPTQPPPTTAPSSGGFDAASFIGGIVLGIAIVVIVAFGYNFYKMRRDKNYHTL